MGNPIVGSTPRRGVSPGLEGLVYRLRATLCVPERGLRVSRNTIQTWDVTNDVVPVCSISGFSFSLPVLVKAVGVSSKTQETVAML